MKMVKSLLLGSAAGLVAVTSGQAADLPVKAKPVEYVKVCSLYGAGFYYMPGTDLCLKIGGWVRAEMTYGINGNSSSGIFGNDYNNRYTNNFWSRERGYITADARDMTPYGVARGYIAVGISSNNTGLEANSGQFSANRAFVQWAGFTAGQSVSFYDFYPAASFLIRAGNVPSEDTGDAGTWIWGYTAQFGGGFSGTISAEDRRDSQIINLGGAAGALFATATPGTNGVLTFGAAGNGYGGWQAPDVIGNLRVDQAWGSAQIMGAGHEVNPGYYGNTPGTGGPGAQWGWVAGAGLRLNFPMIAQGDYAVAEVNYTQGATKYLFNGSGNVGEDVVDTGQQGWAVGSDCVFGGTTAVNQTSCQLTTAWSVNAAYEHYWTPQWHESFVGAYLSERYNGLANAMLCTAEGAAGGVAQGAGSGATAVATPGCSNNWQFWGVGSRLQWDVTKTFYLGVEVLYQQLVTASSSNGFLPTNVILANSGATTQSNESNWTVSVRMHKDFLP
jgi:hypothetical protein